MAITNKDRISRALDALREGLAPFVERELKAHIGANWPNYLDNTRRYPMRRRPDGAVAWDNQSLLQTMVATWNEVFKDTLGRSERSFVGELLEVRNAFAHDDPFSSDDTLRALDTAQRLLQAVSASKAAQAIEAMRQELMRTVFAEQARQQTRRKTLTLEGTPQAGLRPWREVVTPHPDVSSGRYQQAEFAADLAQVHRGEGSDEYRDPREFFSRTYITDGLERLLKGALQRLSGESGDPVVELQTNFGGGKTHSMLALYHLFGAGPDQALPGVEPLLADIQLAKVPQARRAVLVGTALSPGEPEKKPDGTVIHTLWGELAWQLGGKEGYGLVANSDTRATSPGSQDLAELFEYFSPCLILIDEWVAFIRQLYHVSDLPAGSFDANVSFVQALTEAAKAAPKTLVVASLPASQIEIGGEGGQEALARLKNTFSRVQSSWRPATADEGFEIVRRRLFQPLVDQDHFAARDAVINGFSRLYQDNRAEFPQGCAEGAYRRRLEMAYPIHPELFDRLYEDWGSLDRFQRTRGVLRLMAAVIHALWSGNDRGLRIDKEVPNLGRYSATRRVARTIYMGSAPTYKSQNAGIDDRQIRLGSAQPGESPAIFGDALRRLANGATYLHLEGPRYWYSTQPSLTRMADDRAAQLDIHDVWVKLIERLRQACAGNRGDFAGVHVAPESSADVPDETEARLVVLGPEQPHLGKNEQSPAFEAAKDLLTQRGNSPRLYRNTLVFLAPDKPRLQELEDAVRRHMAWSSIVEDAGALDLTQSQTHQARTRQQELEHAINARIGEAWIWLLTPGQPDPHGKIEWTPTRVQSAEPLVVRTSKKLVHEEGLLPQLGPARLTIPLNNYLWANANHINTRQLWEYFATYLYLPRLRDRGVLVQAIEGGVSQLHCDYFGYAEAYDAGANRYLGLITSNAINAPVLIDGDSVLVKPGVALDQEAADQRKRQRESEDTGEVVGGDESVSATQGVSAGGTTAQTKSGPDLPKRFFGSVELNADRLGRDAGRIAEEVLQHLATLTGSRVSVTLEINAEVPEGVAEDLQRIVNENCQVLKFKAHGFERS